jgi:ribosomal protein S18 acetylase RimI-like enzyme
VGAELRVRQMDADDVVQAVETAASAFQTDLSNPADWRWFHGRAEHLLATDPDGSFVAERDGRIVGVAQAMLRDRLWCLSMLAVDPGRQSSGAGTMLLDRALGYGESASAGLIVASNDPRALRLYGRAGFSLRPALEAAGPIERSTLPREDPRVREGSADDLEALEPIAREVRGATYTPELELVLRHGGQLLRFGDRGFAVAHRRYGVWALAARDEEAATALLWSALAHRQDGDRATVRWLTGGQDWAIEVALRAGLRIIAEGALCVRGRPGTLWPFVPSGPFA